MRRINSVHGYGLMLRDSRGPLRRTRPRTTWIQPRSVLIRTPSSPFVPRPVLCSGVRFRSAGTIARVSICLPR
jgi:hypothetical protein